MKIYYLIILINLRYKSEHFMRHYEIVFLVNPEWYNFVVSIIANYKNIIENNFGIIHRIENWGRRRLAYSIKKEKSAFYILMNIECNVDLQRSLVKSLHFNEAVLRYLIIRQNYVVTTTSVMLLSERTTL